MDKKRENFKSKIKKFCYDNKRTIITGVGVGLGLAVLNEHSNRKYYNKGFIDGGYKGFHLTMDWFDKNHGTDLNNIWKNFKNEHPEEVITRKIGMR